MDRADNVLYQLLTPRRLRNVPKVLTLNEQRFTAKVFPGNH
jgi:hypothetical protein